MKLIVGLGNPGLKYRNTRHNVGFLLLDYIANKKKIMFLRNKFNGKYAELSIGGEKVILVKPLSFMNLSGEVVERFASFYKVKLDDILVIQDDIDMNFGRVKIVHNSSSGGHNGIKDIERCLGSKEYTRLKIGVSKNKEIDTKDYVLGKFTKDEEDVLHSIFQELVNVIDDFCVMDLERLMSKYNHK